MTAAFGMMGQVVTTRMVVMIAVAVAMMVVMVVTHKCDQISLTQIKLYQISNSNNLAPSSTHSPPDSSKLMPMVQTP
jgi:hypothetical protein